MAAQQRVRAVDLLADGIVGTVVPEPADDTPQGLVEAVAAEVAGALAG
jgi:acetyl-CoA carboxylase carboxyl transferase subunit beta